MCIQAQAAAATETRWQLWKKTMESKEVNKGFEEEDKIKMRSNDDVQHSTVAGWSTAFEMSVLAEIRM